MIAQRQTINISTTAATADFIVNTNPVAQKVYIYISASGATPTTKTIQARMTPDGTWVTATNDGSTVSPTAGSDTYTEVDKATQYRITLQTTTGSGTATIVVVN